MTGLLNWLLYSWFCICQGSLLDISVPLRFGPWSWALDFPECRQQGNSLNQLVQPKKVSEYLHNSQQKFRNRRIFLGITEFLYNWPACEILMGSAWQVCSHWSVVCAATLRNMKCWYRKYNVTFIKYKFTPIEVFLVQPRLDIWNIDIKNTMLLLSNTKCTLIDVCSWCCQAWKFENLTLWILFTEKICLR